MTRSEGNEVRMNATERWAGSLEGDVARVLIENLSVLLAGKSVAVVQWTSTMRSMAPFRNRLGVDILRFEGSVGGEVVLKARYALFGPDGRKVISAGESIVRDRGGEGIQRADSRDEPGAGGLQPGGRRGDPRPVASQTRISGVDYSDLQETTMVIFLWP